MRACRGQNIVHHEVTCSPAIDMKLLMETLSGYEIAAKKMVRFLVTSHDTQRLTFEVPPPPHGWKPRSAIGDEAPFSPLDIKLAEINALFSKHEGEQRLWAYPMQWLTVDGALDAAFEAYVAQQFPQLRRDDGPWDPPLQHIVNSERGMVSWGRVAGRKTSLLSSLAFGSSSRARSQHLVGCALTLSLPEIFRTYWETATAADLYTEWLGKTIIVKARPRSQRSGDPGPGPLAKKGGEGGKGCKGCGKRAKGGKGHAAAASSAIGDGSAKKRAASSAIGDRSAKKRATSPDIAARSATSPDSAARFAERRAAALAALSAMRDRSAKRRAASSAIGDRSAKKRRRLRGSIREEDL